MSAQKKTIYHNDGLPPLQYWCSFDVHAVTRSWETYDQQMRNLGRTLDVALHTRNGKIDPSIKFTVRIGQPGDNDQVVNHEYTVMVGKPNPWTEDDLERLRRFVTSHTEMRRVQFSTYISRQG